MIRTFYFSDRRPRAEYIALACARYKEEYRVLVDGEFGLPEFTRGIFARFLAEGKTDQARCWLRKRTLMGRHFNPQSGQMLRQTSRSFPDLSLEIADHEFVVFVGPIGVRQIDLAAYHCGP